jgi:hypothetical protein
LNSLFFFLFLGITVGLLFLFAWSLRGHKKLPVLEKVAGSLEEISQYHVTYLPQIRQALAAVDREYLKAKAGGKLARRVEGERKRIVLFYLAALHADFQQLLRLAKAIAVLSPEVIAVQEFERVRLTMEFNYRFQMIRMRLILGTPALPQLSGLSNMVSGLTVQIETAMRDLGERAAIAAELASSLDRRANVT